MFVSLFFVVTAIFIYYPMLQSFVGSFLKVTDIKNVFGSPFFGIKNYIAVFSDTRIYESFYITFKLMALSLIYIPISFMIAYWINGIKNRKLQSFFRVSFFLPYVIPIVALVMIFQVILQSEGGVLNNILSLIIGKHVTIGWLSSSKIARYGVSIISNYASLPFGIIICLAGLQTIPVEIMEAASIDGAGPVSKLFKIVLPNMFGIFTFLIVTQVIAGFQRITDLLIAGGVGGQVTGAPGGSLQSVMLLIYQISFYSATSKNFNYGTVFATTNLLVLCILLVTIILFALLKKIQRRQGK
jgi:ABC-type sugar transport system permease subunit